MKDPDSKLVYSTEWAVPRKEKQVDRKAAVASGKSRTIVRLDKKGRGGKSVTVIEGLSLSIENSETLLKQLKTRLGTGGSAKKGALEIQGDHCEAVIAELSKIGYSPKRSGG